MLPSLRLFDGIAIPSYGLMLFISFAVGIVLFHNRLRQHRLLPDSFRYRGQWLITDIGIAVFVLIAAIWLFFFAPSQWPWLQGRSSIVIWLFRMIIVIITAYLTYGGLVHIRVSLQKRHIPGVDFVTYLALWVLFSAIAGSRLLYVIFHWQEFSHDLVATFAFWRGGLQGLMFYGGLIGALIAGLFFTRSVGMPLLPVFDAAMPSILLGEFFTRIGCFLNGCCFGRPSHLPWAVRFPSGSPASAVGGELLHPTQLYSSLAGLFLFLIALRLERRPTRPGVLFGMMLILYSGARFGIDFVRYYENAANFWVNQGISIVLALVGLSVILFSSRRRKSASSGSAPIRGD